VSPPAAPDPAPAAAPPEPALGLSERERAEYRERGYFVREQLLGEAELELLRDAAEALHRRIAAAVAHGRPEHVELIDGRRYQRVEQSLVKWEWSEALAAAIRSMEPVHPLCARLDALIDDPRLCVPAAELIGERAVSLFTDKLNFKRPQGSPFPWHQDAPYWAFSCAHLERLTSVQLYLDAAREESGCLWLIPASHRAGHLPAPRDRGVLGRLYTDLSQFEHAEPLPICAPAGSAIFFHPYLVHGSRGNRSRDSRRALVLTYQPPGLPLWNHAHARAPRA
jgi:ectoine hydroxylase-related dioxygenase (phytanoyl-CoA dioxygenase family)